MRYLVYQLGILRRIVYVHVGTILGTIVKNSAHNKFTNLVTMICELFRTQTVSFK